MKTYRFYAKDRLALVRKRHGSTQQEMASMLTTIFNKQITYSAYKAWEQRKRSVDTETAQHIARFMKEEFNELWETKQ